MSAGLRRSLARLAALLALFTLAGCYPDLDWKELRLPQAGFRVLMPARVEASSGAGADGIAQSRWAAQTRLGLFGVAWADYPDSAAAHLGTVQDGLVRNAGGPAEAEQSRSEAGVESRRFSVRARAGDGSGRELHVRLIARGARLYQLAVVGQPGALSEADLDTFFLSFQILD